MGLLSSSKQSSTLEQRDQSSTASDQGTAAFISIGRSTGTSVEIGSNSVARASLDAISQNTSQALNLLADNSYKNLVETTDFIESAFNEVLKANDSRLASADANLKASRDFAYQIIANEQTTNDDRLVKLVTYAGLFGLAALAIQAGAFRL